MIAYAQPRSDWAIGFLDEVWWSRFALPRLHTWQDPEYPVRLVEQSWQKNDPDPKALACYGVLWQNGTTEEPVREQMWLRFVTGRPVSEITIQFLDWCCQQLAAQGKRQWLLIWDNASWHVSKMVRTWIRKHNLAVKQTDEGVRACELLLRAGDSKICYDRHSKPIYREEGASDVLFYCIVTDLAFTDE
ncbi:hypothetical protein [Ktedonobacter racemifer]|uniref:Tc1-like transposase DDE domain-containing protein n=1 Tax=Ktedonobacter racemifer DSM 44963 TaxID=485913 RepID=D6U3T4_KTERA|nr:hypothetical protein [Ktedonobacter racemifer]EFH81172.1 hypothetical protein Krac_1870 [Ktedonobacter racemifer DSM 44963]